MSLWWPLYTGSIIYHTSTLHLLALRELRTLNVRTRAFGPRVAGVQVYYVAGGIQVYYVAGGVQVYYVAGGVQVYSVTNYSTC